MKYIMQQQTSLEVIERHEGESGFKGMKIMYQVKKGEAFAILSN